MNLSDAIYRLTTLYFVELSFLLNLINLVIHCN